MTQLPGSVKNLISQSVLAVIINLERVQTVSMPISASISIIGFTAHRSILYRIYSKYSDTFIPYHFCPKLWSSP